MYKTLQDFVGNTPLVRLVRIPGAANEQRGNVLEFRAFQKFFSLWHALHLPLFVMLIIAGTVHVVAVHIY